MGKTWPLLWLVAILLTGCTGPTTDSDGDHDGRPDAFDARAPLDPLFANEGLLGQEATVAAVGYIDRDDLYDLYVGGPDGGTLLLGKSAGRFADATDWEATCAGCVLTAVAIGDLNEDHWNDIVLLMADDIRIFVHKGDRFADETDARLPERIGGHAIALVDLTNDGAVEIVVGSQDAPMRVYRNHLKVTNTTTDQVVYDSVQDDEASEDLNSAGSTLAWEAGSFLAPETLAEGTETEAFTLMYVDADAFLDLVVSTDEGLRLHLARDDGTFHGASADAGFGDYRARTLVPLDVENAQVFDLLAAGPEGVRLFKNTGRDAFADRTLAFGLPKDAAAHAAVPLDADNDGWLDVLAFTESGARLFWSAGGEEFLEVEDAGLGTGALTAAVAADLDRDGRLDVVGLRDGEEAVRFRGTVEDGTYFTLHLFGNQSNSAGFGVRTTLSSTSLIQSRQAGGVGSSALALALDPHFGIGGSRAPEYTLAIIWPSGILQFEAIESSRIVDRRLPATESAKEAPWEEC